MSYLHLTAPDPLSELLYRVDSPVSGVDIFTADELNGWPAGALLALKRYRLIVPTQPADSICCDACTDEHWERVTFVPAPGTDRRAYIRCPVNGRVRVDPQRLHRWQIHVGELANLIGGFLCSQRVRVLAPGRLWGYGALDIADRRCDMFLARGLGWSNSAEWPAIPAISNSADPVIISLWYEPASPPYPGALVAPLPDLLTLNGTDLLFRRDDLARRVAAHPGHTAASAVGGPQAPTSADGARSEPAAPGPRLLRTVTPEAIRAAYDALTAKFAADGNRRRPTQEDLAALLFVSEGTLKRRLAELGIRWPPSNPKAPLED